MMPYVFFVGEELLSCLSMGSVRNPGRTTAFLVNGSYRGLTYTSYISTEIYANERAKYQ